MKTPTRCAIYTRKSADERADNEFSSLENQRSYCSAYIVSQGGNGWTEMPQRYDDGGWSGGTLARPALDQLRSDAAAGLVDTVVVYKIDRLSRSLRDFANLIAEFESHGVTFVSVTQSFDTGSAMGRLTLNVLLSFAQFERELTGERLRDWFAGARARGLWTQQRPYGYTKVPGTNQLVPDEVEAPIVRWIFRRYLKLKSAERVADELFIRGATNTRGRRWTGHMVLHAIQHPIYLGHMVHRRQALPGTHAPIVSPNLWKRANALLADARLHRMGGPNPTPIPLLRGLLFDRTGRPIAHTFLRSKGRLYRYYIAQHEAKRGYGENSNPYMRFRASELEGCVVAAVERLSGYTLHNVRSQYELRAKLRQYIERIDVTPDEMHISFFLTGPVKVVPAGRLGPKRTVRQPKRVVRPW